MNEEKKYSFNKLWCILIEKGMTKQELAEKAQISVSSLTRMKSGKPLLYKNMMRIVDAVGCKELSEIMDEVKKN